MSALDDAKAHLAKGLELRESDPDEADEQFMLAAVNGLVSVAESFATIAQKMS